jgi:hypothetical protein
MLSMVPAMNRAIWMMFWILIVYGLPRSYNPAVYLHVRYRYVHIINRETAIGYVV